MRSTHITEAISLPYSQQVVSVKHTYTIPPQQYLDERLIKQLGAAASPSQEAELTITSSGGFAGH